MKRNCNKLTETTKNAMRLAKKLIKQGYEKRQAIDIAIEKYKDDDMLEILKLDEKIRNWNK